VFYLFIYFLLKGLLSEKCSGDGDATRSLPRDMGVEELHGEVSFSCFKYK